MNFADYMRELEVMLGAGRFTGIEVTEASGLWDELGLDSFDAIRIIVWSEDRAGLDVPEAHIPELFTTGDAWRYLLDLRERAATGRQSGDGPARVTSATPDAMQDGR